MRKALNFVLYFTIVSIVLITTVAIVSCQTSPGVDEARQVKVGISDKELKMNANEFRVLENTGKSVHKIIDAFIGFNGYEGFMGFLTP